MWNKKQVERVPEGYAKKFPQDLGECLICKKPHSGIYMGVVNVSPTDDHVPGYLQGLVETALLAFSLCEACYDLPDIETRVAVALAEEAA